MKQPVHLMIGVPGSGKTWVCSHESIKRKYNIVPHDDYPVPDYGKALIAAARDSNKPILAEAPFRSSVLKEELLRAGIHVVEHYIVETDAILAERYQKREGRPILKQHLTNNARYAERARMPTTSRGMLVRLEQI